MSSLPTVALVGATGNLGIPIREALLSAGFNLKVLTRESSNNKVPTHANQTVVPVDLHSLSSLTKALEGCDVVISAVGFPSLQAQELLVDAALAAGVKRFMASEFGSDLANPSTSALPVFQDKIKVLKYLEKKAQENPGFTWTGVRNSLFFDWGIDVGFLVDAANHKVSIYDGGDIPFSVTRLPVIGATVVAILKNLSLTANQAVYVHDTAVTQNQLVRLIQEWQSQNGTGADEWTVENKSIDDVLKWAYQESAKPDTDPSKDHMGAAYGFIITTVWGQGYGGDFSTKIWNEKLGIPVIETEEELKKVVGEILAAAKK